MTSQQKNLFVHSHGYDLMILHPGANDLVAENTNSQTEITATTAMESIRPAFLVVRPE